MGYDHVIPQFLRNLKGCSDKTKTYDFPIQGSGVETRSFMYIDDFVEALIVILENVGGIQVFHVGTEDEINIMDLASLLASLCGIKIEVIKGDLLEGSALRRCPDISKLRALGFLPKISLEEGLARTRDWYWPG